MGSLNAGNIHLHLWRVINHSAEISYTFTQKHPFVSAALLVLFILYIFLSYIYNFLIYISPFLVCTAIFVRIFWSSEPIQIINVKKEDKKREKESDEAKFPNYGRREVLYKCPSQNATSRRRNFTGRKLDVYGGLGERAKDLSEVFKNEFTKGSKIRKFRSFHQEKGSLDFDEMFVDAEALTNQPMFSEPSMLEPVGSGGVEKEAEKINKDEKEAEEDDENKYLDGSWDEDDKMDLGITETERTKRLESLIARRRANNLVKMHLQKALIDLKSVRPSQIAPLHIPRDHQKSFDGIEGIEMPGSAPTNLKSPFDLPYDPSEEKPILTGDNFGQEFTSQQKDMVFCRHESFALGPSFLSDAGHDKLAYPKARRHADRGNHNLDEQLISEEGDEMESQPLNPPIEEEETTPEADGKCEIDIATTDMNDEEEESANAKNSIIDVTSDEPDPTPNNDVDVEKASVSAENPTPKAPKPQERVFSFPIPGSTTSANDSLDELLPSPVDKSNENIFNAPWRPCHTPSCSLGSDLQVEVSEAGSPTLTVEGSHLSPITTDEESIIYDGDIDKDITSGSEDMWGASLHSREVRRLSEQDIAEASNLRDIASTVPPPNIDEENAADVSSMSSKSDLPDDTPTHAISTSAHNNFFGNVKDFVGESGAPQPFHPPRVASPFKRLKDTRVDHLHDHTQAEKSEELCNLSTDLINRTQVTNDVNNSASTEQDNTNNSGFIEQDNTNNSKTDEESAGASVVHQREATNEVSTNSSTSSSSPRSVLPRQTMADQVSSSDHNQELHLDVQQSTLTVEGPLDSMSRDIYPYMGEYQELHSSDQVSSSEQTMAEQVSSSDHNQELELGVQQSNMEDVSQATLTVEGPRDSMSHDIHPSMDENKELNLSDQVSSSERTMEEQVSSSDHHQELHLGVQQSIMEDVSQATSTIEGPLDSMSHDIHPLMNENQELNLSDQVSSSERTMEEQVSSLDHHQEFHSGVQQSNMEDVSQATLIVDGPLDSISHDIHPLMDDPTNESHTRDLGHSQVQTYNTENSIQEPNISSNMNGEEVSSKDTEVKIKNDEINEESIPLTIRDAREEPPGPSEMMTSEDMNEKSRELLHDKDTMADQGSSLDHHQELRLSGIQRSNMEDVSHATSTVEGPIDSMTHDIHPSNDEYQQLHLSDQVSSLEQIMADQVYSSDHNQELSLGDVQQSSMSHDSSLMDDPTIESQSGDLSHFQVQAHNPGNSILETNISCNMNEEVVSSKEPEEKIKNDEISETSIPLTIQDAREETPGPSEIMNSEDMNEKSRELLHDKVPLNSQILECSSEVHKQNEEDQSQASIRQEATTEPLIIEEEKDANCTKEFEGNQNNLNNNEDIGSCRSLSAEESKMIEETDKANHGLEEVNFFHGESNQVVEDHIGKEKLENSDISEDSSSQPKVTEDSLGESEKKVKNDVTEQEFNKNETMVLSESTGEGGEASQTLFGFAHPANWFNTRK